MDRGHAQKVGEAGVGIPAYIAPEPTGVSGMGEMMEAKLWQNPCWFSFRINYLALRYNSPVYDWIRRKFGLSRPEYVAIYSLALCQGGQAHEIVRSSGFPKNTLSRAIARLEKLDLIERKPKPGAGRSQALYLTQDGLDLFNKTIPVLFDHEQTMLAALSEDERVTLSRIMAKMALSSAEWPLEFTD